MQAAEASLLMIVIVAKSANESTVVCKKSLSARDENDHALRKTSTACRTVVPVASTRLSKTVSTKSASSIGTFAETGLGVPPQCDHYSMTGSVPSSELESAAAVFAVFNSARSARANLAMSRQASHSSDLAIAQSPRSKV